MSLVPNIPFEDRMDQLNWMEFGRDLRAGGRATRLVCNVLDRIVGSEGEGLPKFADLVGFNNIEAYEILDHFTHFYSNEVLSDVVDAEQRQKDEWNLINNLARFFSYLNSGKVTYDEAGRLEVISSSFLPRDDLLMGNRFVSVLSYPLPKPLESYDLRTGTDDLRV